VLGGLTLCGLIRVWTHTLWTHTCVVQFIGVPEGAAEAHNVTLTHQGEFAAHFCWEKKAFGAKMTSTKSMALHTPPCVVACSERPPCL
jgi:hypothetical protein